MINKVKLTAGSTTIRYRLTEEDGGLTLELWAGEGLDQAPADAPSSQQTAGTWIMSIPAGRPLTAAEEEAVEAWERGGR